MTDLILTEREIFGLLESEDQFPIDFDKAWQAKGFTRKDSAKRHLVQFFEKGKDFKVVKGEPGKSINGRPSEKIFLTKEAFSRFSAQYSGSVGEGVGGRTRNERFHQNRLCKELNGKKEVKCQTGIVDILTDTEVIEVKEIKSWKSAIGQALVYTCEFKDRSPRIHLYGEASEQMKYMIISYAQQLGINVTFSD